MLPNGNGNRISVERCLDRSFTFHTVKDVEQLVKDEPKVSIWHKVTPGVKIADENSQASSKPPITNLKKSFENGNGLLNGFSPVGVDSPSTPADSITKTICMSRSSDDSSLTLLTLFRKQNLTCRGSRPSVANISLPKEFFLERFKSVTATPTSVEPGFNFINQTSTAQGFTAEKDHKLMDNPVLWVLQAPSRSVGFPTENLMPWPGQVSDKSVSDAFSDFSSDVCDYNSIMANPSMYRPGPCLSSLLYSERSLDQDLLDNAGTNCMNGTAQYWDNTENNNNNMRTSSRSSSCNSSTANLEVNNGAAFGHFWGFDERLDASDITSENERKAPLFLEKAETEYAVKWSEMLPPFSSHTQEETLPMYITTDSKSQDLVSTSNINNHNQAALNSVVFPISWQQLQNTEYPVLGDRATMLSTPLSDPDFHRIAAVLDQI